MRNIRHDWRPLSALEAFGREYRKLLGTISDRPRNMLMGFDLVWIDMTREEKFTSISRALGTLSYRIVNENASGMNSLNAMVEDILLPVLATLFDLPDLKNLNVSSANTEVVD